MPALPAEVLSNFGHYAGRRSRRESTRLLVDLTRRGARRARYPPRRRPHGINGALVIEDGERTGRSPNDRLSWHTDVHDKIAPGRGSTALSVESYEAIKAGIVDYLNERDVFVTRGMAGADRNHTRRLLVARERASQALLSSRCSPDRLPAKSRAAQHEPTSACSQRQVTSATRQGPQLQRCGGHINSRNA